MREAAVAPIAKEGAGGVDVDPGAGLAPLQPAAPLEIDREDPGAGGGAVVQRLDGGIADHSVCVDAVIGLELGDPGGKIAAVNGGGFRRRGGLGWLLGFRLGRGEVAGGPERRLDQRHPRVPGAGVDGLAGLDRP